MKLGVAVDVVGIGLTLAMATYLACNPAHDIADTAYADELSACVDHAATLADSKACRAQVRERWGIVVTDRKDAGHGD